MHFQHLTNVHTRRNAQGVQHDVHGSAVGHVRHVFHRGDLGDHTLVTVAAGHLVTGLQAALDRDVDLDHFEHACWQLVTLRELLALFFKSQIEAVAGLLQRVLDALQLGGDVLIGRTDVKPMELLDRSQVGFVYLGALGQLVGAAVGSLPVEQFGNTVKRVGFHNAQLVVQVQAEALEFIVDDLLGALVAGDAFTGEDLHVDDGAG